MEARYLRFGDDVPPGGELGRLFPGGRELVGAPKCSCCGEGMRLLCYVLHVAGADGETLLAFQCRNVGAGGTPEVVAVLARIPPMLPGGVVMGGEPEEDPEELGEPSDDALDQLLRPKLGGLVAFGKRDLLPVCSRCGRSTQLALQLDEEPGGFNFATRPLVVAECAEGHPPELVTAFL